MISSLCCAVLLSPLGDARESKKAHTEALSLSERQKGCSILDFLVIEFKTLLIVSVES